MLRGACRALPHPAVPLPPLSALRGHSRCAAAFDWAACARAGSTASALYFGADGAAARFVSLRHDDEAFKYFFGELLLCFRFEHEGVTHECVFVEYVWPEIRTAAQDGVPLETRYSHTRRRTIAVAPVAAVHEALKSGMLLCELARRVVLLATPRCSHLVLLAMQHTLLPAVGLVYDE